MFGGELLPHDLLRFGHFLTHDIVWRYQLSYGTVIGRTKAGFEPAKEYPPGKPLSDYESGVYASNFIVLVSAGFEPTSSITDDPRPTGRNLCWVNVWHLSQD